MDEAEVARLRKEANVALDCNQVMDEVDQRTILALLDALEQARNSIEFLSRMVTGAQTERDAARQDAKDARALLADIEMAFEQRFRMPNAAWQEATAALRARIEAMLEKKI